MTSGNTPSQTSQTVGDFYDVIGRIGSIFTLKVLSQTSLAKLIVSYDLLCSMVNNQIAFNQQDSKLIPKFERVMDCCCEVLVSKLKTLDTITFT